VPPDPGDDDVLETKPELGRAHDKPAEATKSALPAITEASLPVLAAYEELLEQELEDQTARKASLEQRGLAVITTAGAVVTLLFGLGALATKAHSTFSLPADARLPLAAALAVFFLAALFALATNLPMHYETVTSEAIDARLRRNLEADDVASTRRRLALTRVKELRDAKTKNTRKARLLFAAMCCEVVGVALVAMAVWIIVSP
jgi:hypothetical protein